MIEGTGRGDWRPGNWLRGQRQRGGVGLIYRRPETVSLDNSVWNRWILDKNRRDMAKKLGITEDMD